MLYLVTDPYCDNVEMRVSYVHACLGFATAMYSVAIGSKTSAAINGMYIVHDCTAVHVHVCTPGMYKNVHVHVGVWPWFTFNCSVVVNCTMSFLHIARGSGCMGLTGTVVLVTSFMGDMHVIVCLVFYRKFKHSLINHSSK